jgi:hypothetical protein
MSDLPFSTLDLHTADIDAITLTFDYLKKKFDVSYDVNFSYDFNRLEVFANRKISIGPAIKITNPFQSFDLVFIQVGYSYAYGRKYSFGLTYEYQTWGVTTLKNDFGHILIKPETLLDKIHDLISPVEIDFPDDLEFSKRFYVVTNDATKARAQLKDSFRATITKLSLKDFIIEIVNNKLVIGNRKILEPESAIAFASFMDNLSRTE